MGKLNFSRRGVTIAYLRSGGKVDSVRQRLRKVVIGSKSADKQDLRRKVGMTSSEQKEPSEERTILLTYQFISGCWSKVI